MNDKKMLAIVTTDMEIELAMLIHRTDIANARNIVKQVREAYYNDEAHGGTFEDAVAESLTEHNIDFELLEYTEM